MYRRIRWISACLVLLFSLSALAPSASAQSDQVYLTLAELTVDCSGYVEGVATGGPGGTVALVLFSLSKNGYADELIQSGVYIDVADDGTFSYDFALPNHTYRGLTVGVWQVDSEQPWRPPGIELGWADSEPCLPTTPSDAAHACQQGGYANWARQDGSEFKNTGQCVKYVADDGLLKPSSAS